MFIIIAAVLVAGFALLLIWPSKAENLPTGKSGSHQLELLKKEFKSLERQGAESYGSESAFEQAKTEPEQPQL